MLARLLVRFLSLITAVFFRTREVAGRERIPVTGPVIFAGNHPNSLLDPILILTTCGRPVRFAAKDVLFQSRFLRPLLRLLGAIPVRRRKDHPGAAAEGGTIDNQAAFEAMFEALAAGDACGIFPEGISHDGSELAPLRTGLARIALGAGARRPPDAPPVRIVPCGLSYFSPTRMRSRVLVEFGPPLEVDAARLAAFAQDERAAVQALTEEVHDALRSLTVNAPDYESLRVLTGVRQLYASQHDLPLAAQTELSRRFLDRWQELRAEPEVAALYGEVRAYLIAVDSLGFTDPLLRAPLTIPGWARLLGMHLLLIFVLLPLALPGLLLHAPLLLAAVVFGDGLTRKRNVRATTKVVTLALGVLVIYGLVIGGVAWLTPRQDRLPLALCTAALLPTCGWATIRVLERQSALRHAFVTLSLLVVLRREVRRLRAQRDGLRQRIHAAVERYAGGTPRILPPPPAE